MPCLSLSMFIGILLIFGRLHAMLIIIYVYGHSIDFWKKTHIGLLNSIVAGSRSPIPTGVDHICNKARLLSWLLLVHILIVCLTNLKHASTWPLLWWWYDVMACCMFSFLQKSLKVSDVMIQIRFLLLIMNASAPTKKVKMHTYIAPLETQFHLFLISGTLHITSPAGLLHPTLVWRFQEAANIPMQDGAWPVCPLMPCHYWYSFTPEWSEVLSIWSKGVLNPSYLSFDSGQSQTHNLSHISQELYHCATKVQLPFPGSAWYIIV